MSALSRRWKRRALRREQESLEFYAAIAGDKGRWGQRYRDHVAEHGPLSDVWGHEQMLRRMTPAIATSLPETTQNPTTGNPTTPSINNDRPSANGGDE